MIHSKENQGIGPIQPVAAVKMSETPMHSLIRQHLPQIRSLGRSFGVERLEVFGSVATDRFDPIRSDIDFIVTYPPDYDFGPWLARFTALEDELAALLGRSVDLVMATAPAMSKQRFRQEADKTRTVVYDAIQIADVA